MSRLVRLADPLLRTRAGSAAARVVLRAWIGAVSRGEPRAAVRTLLELHDDLYRRIDVLAAQLDDGVHVKHRLMRYHDFFVERIGADERVLDVGCGKGALAFELAARAGARVVGIDVNRSSLEFARRRFPHERLEFVEADATTFRPAGRFDVVVLSNVLEHIADRVGLLRHLAGATGAQRFLVRVPVLRRHWLVPLRQELQLPYLSDPTHEIEYDVETFRRELGKAGLGVEHLEVVWGEIWAAARTDPGSEPLSSTGGSPSPARAQ